MSDEPDSLILRYLRNIDTRLGRLEDSIAELRGRTGAVEEGLVSIARRLDRLDERVQRIERRFDLIEGPVPTR